MSESKVTRAGQEGVRPGREAPADFSTPRRRRRRGGRGEQAMVPEAEFSSYYGKPVLNKPVWKEPDIPGYLFLGGLAGASSAMAAAADLTGQRELARAGKVGATVGALLSLVALVNDLGKPSRFLNMLRVFKVTSPMSVGSWLLAGYVPATAVAAASSVTGRARPLGALATAGSAALGPAVATYTGALISDTAVPAWHDGHREMPYVFAGSAAMAAGGLGMLAAPRDQQSMPRRLALLGSVGELTAAKLMERRMGTVVREPYKTGKAGRRMKLGQALAASGAVLGVLGHRSRAVTAAGGALLMASSAVTRFGIFGAGIASAEDPKYTVQPQRERLDRGEGTRRS